MKRARLSELRKHDKWRKQQCLKRFEDFKEAHAYEWKYEEEADAFMDLNGMIQAYRFNGILYYADEKPVDLSALDMPVISVDAWQLVMRYLNGGDIMNLGRLCVSAAKAAARAWKERGAKLAQKYGPVFTHLLRMNKMSYSDFYDMCSHSYWRKEWLPFEVLFRLPPGAAAEYIGNIVDDHGTRKNGVILLRDGSRAGYYYRKPKARNLAFFWNPLTSRDTQSFDAKQKWHNSFMLRILRSGDFESPICEWRNYKEWKF